MMNTQQILRKIGDIIQELHEQQQYLKNSDEISELELELFTANADFLIDHIQIIKKLNLAKPERTSDFKIQEHSVKQPIQLPEEFPKPPIQENEEDIIEKDIEGNELIEEEDNEEFEEEIEGPMFDFSFEDEPQEMIFDFEKKIKVEEVFDRELSDEEKELINSKKEYFNPKEEEKDDEQIQKLYPENFREDEVELEHIEIEDDDIEENGPEPFLVIKEDPIKPIQIEVEAPKPIIIPPVNEDKPAIQRITEKRLTLNEMLSEKLGSKPASSNSNGKSISDLKVSISLNDKMLFIKELFNGYNLAYSEAIEIINRLETFDAADNFLKKNYAIKNDWQSKVGVVDRLYEYLNRKFIS